MKRSKPFIGNSWLVEVFESRHISGFAHMKTVIKTDAVRLSQISWLELRLQCVRDLCITLGVHSPAQYTVDTVIVKTFRMLVGGVTSL